MVAPDLIAKRDSKNVFGKMSRCGPNGAEKFRQTTLTPCSLKKFLPAAKLGEFYQHTINSTMTHMGRMTANIPDAKSGDLYV